MSLPKSTDAWVTKGTTGLDDMVFETGRPLPAVEDHDVMVKFHGASLNYRDIAILTVGMANILVVNKRRQRLTNCRAHIRSL